MSRSGGSSPQVRTATAVAVALGSAVFALSALAAGDRPAAWELPVSRHLYDLPGPLTPVLDVVMQAGTRGAVLVLALALAAWRRPRPALAVLVAGGGGWLAATIAKEVVDRDRPTAELLGRPLREVVSGGGFPSSHTAVATALAVAFLLVHRTNRITCVAVISVAALTGVARVHLGVHLPLDVIGGAGVGAVTGAIGASLAARHVQAPPSATPSRPPGRRLGQLPPS